MRKCDIIHVDFIPNPNSNPFTLTIYPNLTHLTPYPINPNPFIP